MPTYFIFETTTREGMLTVTDAPKRSEGLPAAAASYGVKIIEWFFLAEVHDFVMKVEAPDDETIMTFVLSIARGGNVTPRFSRAFSPAEWTEMVGKIT